MRKLFMSVFVLAIIFRIAIPASAQTITVRADSWMPYTGDPAAERPGYCIEIIKAIFEPAGYTIDYQTVAWTRAVADVEADRIDAIVGGDQHDCPKCLFPEQPIGISQNFFYVKKGNPWTFQGIDSLKGQRLGVIDGYSYDTGLIDDYIHAGDIPDVQKATGDLALERNLRKLEANRLDVIIENNYVLPNTLSEISMAQDSVVPAGKANKADVIFISFAPGKESSKKYLKIWSEGIKKLRESGKLKGILTRYNLPDWELSKP